MGRKDNIAHYASVYQNHGSPSRKYGEACIVEVLSNESKENVMERAQEKI